MTMAIMPQNIDASHAIPMSHHVRKAIIEFVGSRFLACLRAVLLQLVLGNAAHFS